MPEFNFSGTPTFDQARTIWHGWTRELIELLSIWISGQNPDGTSWIPNGTGVPVYLASASGVTVQTGVLGIPSSVFLNTDANGAAFVDLSLTPGTSTTVISTAAVSNASATLKVANTSRSMLSFFNNEATGGANAYLLLGGSGVASTTNFTVKVAPQQLYELPVGRGELVYQGAIYIIWDANTAAASGHVTEQS